MARNASKAIRIERMRRAWALAQAGKPQATIARELGCHQSQVSRYLAAIGRKTWDRLEDDAKTYVLLSLAQTDTVLFESLEAFERSKRPKKSATRKTSPGGTTKGAPTDPADGSTTTSITEREGEPAWLAKVIEAIRLRADLLDRFAPPTRKPATDETSDAATVAAALLEAERRDAEYRSSGDESPDEPHE